jgi:hypothetical protein
VDGGGAILTAGGRRAVGDTRGRGGGGGGGGGRRTGKSWHMDVYRRRRFSGWHGCTRKNMLQGRGRLTADGGGIVLTAGGRRAVGDTGGRGGGGGGGGGRRTGKSWHMDAYRRRRFSGWHGCTRKNMLQGHAVPLVG